MRGRRETRRDAGARSLGRAARLCSVVLVAGLVLAAAPARANSPESPRANSFDELILNMVRDAVPREYENRKQWGKTKNVVSGLNVRFDGLELKTKRRRKEVNHGDWKLYRVTLLDPERDLQIELRNARQTDDGKLRFDLVASARLETFGRYSAWRYDVQLISLSALAYARVQLIADCEVAMRIDPVHVPPDIVLVPHVRDARLELLEFELDRLSQLHGDLAEELGKGLRLVIDEVLEKQRDKLTEKMNRQIAKHQDRLRLSLHDYATSRFKKE